MAPKETVLPSGLQVEATTNHERLWNQLIKHYSSGSAALWQCPWCGGAIDAVCDERDDELFHDTWACYGDCNLLITFITPAEYREYWQVPDGLWKVLIESAFGGDWFAPEEANDLVDPTSAR